MDNMKLPPSEVPMPKPANSIPKTKPMEAPVPPKEVDPLDKLNKTNKIEDYVEGLYELGKSSVKHTVDLFRKNVPPGALLVYAVRMPFESLDNLGKILTIRPKINL